MILFRKYAGVAELEYARALGARLARVVSSSLTAGTLKNPPSGGFLILTCPELVEGL